MDRVRTLALYDQEMRQNPPEEPGTYIDRSDGIVRLVGERSWIAFSRLASRDAAEAVERETSRFRKAGVELEWKLFDHDGPPEMGRLLAAAGFRPDLPETLMALDLGGPIVPFSAAAGISIDRISDALGVRDAVRVSHRAFAPEEGWNEEEYLGRIADPSMVILGARGEGHLVAVGRLELPDSRSFASLWGGGTLPAFRGRGIYRALVHARAEIARTRGYRFLTVDARATSRPILERIGFEPIANIVGWVLRSSVPPSD
ncbi:MAG TPA: GNAT family N-acetyltransferase [Thermoplasmata archaeon]|nr:GNAT family N-acetyltransferase [Thermoplasmata archaeon]